jgi:hypothetical protein
VTKRARLLSFFLLLFSPAVATLARASTFTAATCNYSDVNAIINGPTHTAANGDVINIPAGTCTWTSNLVIPSNIGITIIGAGTPNSGSGTTGAATPTTIIHDNAGSSTFLIAAAPTFGQTLRISMMAIDPNSSSTTLYAPVGIAGTCTSSGCGNVRVDNITFGLNTLWVEANNGSQAAAMIRVDNVFGVLDHNTAPSGSNVELFNAQMTSYLGVGSNGDNSWAQPDSLGGAGNIFAENNLWFTGYLGLNDCEAGAIGGCRVVVRYNTMTASQTGAFGIFENHGTETAGRGRSGREAEVYNNTLTCQGACASVDGGIRGGTGMLFGNHAVLTPGQGANTWMGLSLYRNVYTATPWGACGGSGPYDKNDGTTYYSGTMTASGLTMTDSLKSWTTNQLAPAGNPYSVYDVTQGFWAEIASNTATTITVISPISESSWTGFNNGDSYQILRASVCIDQPGRGAGTYISGTTPSTTGWVNEPLDPIYQWADFATGGANVNNPMNSGSGKVIANRDYYPQVSGIQTSATSPFNGTSGTGWGTVANRPTTCTTGVGYAEYSSGNFVQLDKCTATNTWTSGVYTAFTYPHPLDTNGSTTGSGPGAAANLKATAF